MALTAKTRSFLPLLEKASLFSLFSLSCSIYPLRKVVIIHVFQTQAYIRC